MVKQLTTERRKANRAKRILSIQFRVFKSRNKSADTRWHLSTTHDMSIIGLSFLSDVPVMVDDVLELNVVMSGVLDIFKGYGRVMRVERKDSAAFYLVAVKFTKTKPATRKTTTKQGKSNRIRKIKSARKK